MLSSSLLLNPFVQHRKLIGDSLAALGMFAVPAVAAEIDVAKLVQKAAKGTSAAKKVDEANAICRTVPLMSKKDCQKLEIRDIRIRAGEVRYSEVKAAPIPETIKTESFVFRNCSSNERKDARTVTITYQEGYSIVTADSISRTGGVNATLNIKGPQLGISESRQVSFTETKAQDFSTSVTEVVNFEELIKPFTALVVTVEKRISNAFLEFDGDLILDAGLYSSPCCGWRGPTVYLGQLSTMAPRQKVTVRGQIWNAKAQSTQKSYSELELDRHNPAHCPQMLLPPKSAGAAAQSAARRVSNELLNNTVIAQAAADRGRPNRPGSTPPPSKRVVRFVSGMTINTANVVSNIEVRAKSMGPGFCGVRFQTFGGTTQFLAPPLSWSPWTNLAAHIGTANFTVTNEVLCETGVLAELRYSK